MPGDDLLNHGVTVLDPAPACRQSKVLSNRTLIILKHLGLTAGGRRIKDCDAMVEQIVPRHLCLFAIHPSGKPIGVAINNDCQKSELEVPTEQVNSSSGNKIIDGVSICL